MSIYEIGYMENDAITINKEKEPNIRIEKEDITFIQGNFKMIIALRILLLAIICNLVYFFGLLSLEKILLLCGYIGLSRLFFYLHNTIRSRWNIATYFVLCVLKYYLVVWVFMDWDFGIEPYLIVLFSFPILRTIEHSVKKKYELERIQNAVGSLDTFRVMYYSVLLLITVFGFLFFGSGIRWVYSIGFFFVFRFGIFALIKSGIYSRQVG
ncbi:wbuO protein [Cecembia lonarensis]|nr:wbuO protein [Cecembia lonarensis]